MFCPVQRGVGDGVKGITHLETSVDGADLQSNEFLN